MSHRFPGDMEPSRFAYTAGRPPSHLAESGFFPVMRMLKACALSSIPGRSTAPRAPLAHPRPGRPRCVHVPLTCSAGPAPGTCWSRCGLRSPLAFHTWRRSLGSLQSAPPAPPRGRISSPFMAENGRAVCASTPHLSSATVSGGHERRHPVSAAAGHAAVDVRGRVSLGTTSSPPARVCTLLPSLHASMRPRTLIQLLVSFGL